MSVRYYFLGGNTASGFYSCYDSFCRPEEGNFLWVIKGGPGSGKSTLMRKLGSAAEDAGLDVEYVLCSGDPESLDGVYFPQKKVGYVDGTAPHVREPAYPGISGAYLDLSRFLDRKGLQGGLERAAELNRAYKAQYANAYTLMASYPMPPFPLAPDSQRERFLNAVTCAGISRTDIGTQTDAPIPPDADLSRWILYRHPLWPELLWAAEDPETGNLYKGFQYLPELEAPISCLRQAKELHDRLEQLYSGHLDHKGLDRLAKQHIRLLLEDRS